MTSPSRNATDDETNCDFEVVGSSCGSGVDRAATNGNEPCGRSGCACVQEFTSQLNELRKEMQQLKTSVASLVAFDNRIARMEAKLNQTGTDDDIQTGSSPLQSEVVGHTRTTSVDASYIYIAPEVTNDFVFVNNPAQSIMIAEAGKRVVETGFSHKGQTVLIDPPIFNGSRTLTLQMNPRGIKYSPYIGFMMHSDCSNVVLGDGRSDSRLGVEVPLSWGFSCVKDSIVTSFEPPDVSTWSWNPREFYASETSQFWSKYVPGYDCHAHDMKLTADVDTGCLCMCVGNQTMIQSMPPGTAVRFAVTLRCRTSFKIIS